MGSGSLSWIVLGVTTLGLAVLVASMRVTWPTARRVSRPVTTILRCGWIAWHSGVSLRSLLMAPGLNTISDVMRPVMVRPVPSRWPRAREPGRETAKSPPASLFKQPLRSPIDPR